MAAGAVAGGAAGGIIGSLTDAGVDEDKAHVYAEGIRRGSTLVSVRVDNDQADVARSVINDSSPVELSARRAMYRGESTTLEPLLVRARFCTCENIQFSAITLQQLSAAIGCHWRCSRL